VISELQQGLTQERQLREAADVRATTAESLNTALQKENLKLRQAIREKDQEASWDLPDILQCDAFGDNRHELDADDRGIKLELEMLYEMEPGERKLAKSPRSPKRKRATVTLAPPTDGEWRCRICTVYNDREAPKCTVCESMAPRKRLPTEHYQPSQQDEEEGVAAMAIVGGSTSAEAGQPSRQPEPEADLSGPHYAMAWAHACLTGGVDKGSQLVEHL